MSKKKFQATRVGRFAWATFAATLLFAARVPGQEAPQPDELIVSVGSTGFLTSWLKLGPIQQPDGFKKKIEELATRDPLGLGQVRSSPSEGEAAARSRWSFEFSSSKSVRISGKKPSVAYFAVVLRTASARRIWLSTGSDESLEVWLNANSLLKRVGKRRALADSDLTSLNLEPGDNLLVLKLSRSERGPWRFFARLMDGSFGPLEGVEIVLPGAVNKFQAAIEQSVKLKVSRKLDLDARAVDVTARLEFSGGRPSEGKVPCKVSFLGPESPDEQEREIDLSTAGSDDLMLGEFRFEGQGAPSVVRVELGGLELKRSLGFRMLDVAGLAEAFANLKASKDKEGLPRTSRQSAAWRVEHLKALIEKGDTDYEYLTREIKDTGAIAKALAEGRDPYADRRGEIQRRGYLSKLDGSYQHYALYVPWGWKEEGDESFGLVVSLHGLNGVAMNNLQAVFGVTREESETPTHRERYPKRVGPGPFFVLSPSGFGNSGYRAFGEVDVLEAIAQVRERYRINPDRIYITGLSMGGIGSASIPLHFPDMFAAAAPLCGYHSLFIYRSIRAATLKPWESFMASFRSNKDWALNGRYLPLYVVHGLRDNPRHSDVLVGPYRKLGYEVKYENPNLGHHIWQQTYENRRIFPHFAKYKRAAHPQKITFTTSRLRYRASHWIEIDDAVDYANWSTVKADWSEKNEIEITTSNLESLTVKKDEVLLRDGAVSISVDGRVFDAKRDSAKWSFHKDGETWAVGPAPKCEGLCKRPGLAGPLADAFFEPLLFVYGTGDPGEEKLARRLIKKLKKPMSGVTIDWPVKSDVDVVQEDIEKYSLVIVGTTRNHALLSKIADKLPIRGIDGAVEAGKSKFWGDSVAASFIYPNPLNPKRYVVVHTGASTQALFYLDHLPELLPDYVIYNASMWPKKGGRVLGDDRDVLKAGFFDRNWGL